MALIVAGVLVGGLPVFALAGHQATGVTQYAGCLKTNGSGNGNISAVAVGTAPLVGCKAGEIEIHFSGGDITAVVAGPGLTGGGTNGAVELALDDAFQLPQACADGEIPEWNGSGWDCGADDNTTYTSGTGLDLSGANAFSIEPDYRLPQTCGAGEGPEWSGSAWVCSPDDVGADIGGIAATSPIVSVDTIASDGECEDGPGGNFTSMSSNEFDTPAFTLAAGTYRPEPTGEFRWFVSKEQDQDDGESFYNGAVYAQIVDVGANQVLSTWARAEASNGDGAQLPYNQDFKPFTTNGGQFALRGRADGSGCTRARLLDAAVDFYLVND